jgi:MFS family permease
VETLEKSTADSRRGWIVVSVTCVTLCVVYGAWYSYSVFLVAFLREFGWSRSVIAGAFSAFVLVHGSVAPIIGWLARRFGPRRLIMAGGCVMGFGLLLTAGTTRWWHLYLAYSGITAIGFSMAGWIPAVVLVGGWFPRRVATALGITSVGIGVGISGLVPLSQFLIDLCGWRWTLRLLAALIVGWVLPATACFIREPAAPEAFGPRPEPQPVSVVTGPGAYWTLAAAARGWRFWGLAGVFFTGNLVTQTLLVHQVAYLVDHGVSALTAATVGGLAGLVSIAGKIGWGVLADRSGRELAYSLGYACAAGSLGILVLAGWYPTSNLPYVYAVLIGLGYAVNAPVPAAVANDLFGGPGFSMIYGTLYVAICLGIASGAWGAGKIFDVTGSYAAALWVAFAMAVLSPILLWVVAPRRPNPPPRIHSPPERQDRHGRRTVRIPE